MNPRDELNAANDRQRKLKTVPGEIPAGSAALSDVLGLGDDPIASVWRESPHADAPLNVRLRSGKTLRWDHQRDLMKPDTLVQPIVLARGLPGPSVPLTKAQTFAVVNRLIDMVQTDEEHDALAEARMWVDGFERDRRWFERDMSDRQARYDAILWLTGYRREEVDHGWLHAPVLVDSATGTRFIRTQDLADYVRRGCRVTIGWPELNARLSEISWRPLELQAWPPDVPRAEAVKTRVMVYWKAPK